MGFIATLILLLLLAFWVYEFVQLMLLGDADFPSRNDKTLWVVAFVMMFMAAPFAFLIWKSAYAQMGRHRAGV